MGLGGAAPHDPLQAVEETDPVLPLLIPIAGAKENATSLSSCTLIALQVWPLPAVHGIAQIEVLHLAPLIVPGLQVPGISPDLTVLVLPVDATMHQNVTVGFASGSLAAAKASATFLAPVGSLGREYAAA
jgi:hypothetical protein